MYLQQRIALLVELGEYLISDNEEWNHIKRRAEQKNGWFIQAFINKATQQIAENFLRKDLLENWAAGYGIEEENNRPKTVGIVMAGNIPLVGFHDWLCVFISGHKAVIKLSSKDDILLKHLVEWMSRQNEEVIQLTRFEEQLKGCDAYIATGSNNTSRYFEYYFGKFPNIIRKNRTSVGLIRGNESEAELSALADDVHLYFGRGCRNITKLYVPRNYDFVPMINAFAGYKYFFDHQKYRNNYDYNLALRMLSKEFYMTSGSVIFSENPSLFTPVAQLHFEYYENLDLVKDFLNGNESVQCIAGREEMPFGTLQTPRLTDYADGVDTLKFLQSL